MSMFSFTTYGGSEYPLQAISYNQDILINYELIERSDRKRESIDRGPQTDRYATTLSFKGTPEYVNQLVYELQLLRTNKLPIVLNNIPEPIFGDHVDISNPITTLVYDIDKQSTTSLNRQDLKVTLLVETSSLTFVGNNIVPLNMNCLRHKWAGYSEWNTSINESYNSTYQFVDREADTYVFEGEYIINKDEVASLFNYWRTIARGNEITINESDWGATQMFGGTISSPTHPVIINSITYDKLSPVLRAVKVEMIRNGY